MVSPVTLPRLSWGDPASDRHALLAHGLGSTAALMWRFGLALADAGWYAQAVDLRGHGDAPRALDYRIEAYAADLAHTHPNHAGAWDLVIGHSLGGTSATLASARHPRWARRLVLVDPAIHLDDEQREAVNSGQAASFDDPSAESVHRANPRWHAHDVELKVDALRRTSRWAVEQTGVQNTTWDVRDAASAVTVPAHVIAADPEVNSLFQGETARRVLTNPCFTMSVVTGAGHSPHRDDPEQTMTLLMEALR
ncbi:MAG TPA: alpha/beta hydrolase [Microbacterium sp.]|uniref:alpha/beta fold hydrolase n=1 Tax=Microbacterium sp. TaxID=51671 RepID=UPI002B45E1F1|nr:alpha/beta hydrolase [Microbacterium sp.]HKT57300.1 alpha/beta hydrolase [Microbacterium sp.]